MHMRVGPRMPRYYFDIENGQPYRDEIGEDLADDRAAWRTAVRRTREIELSRRREVSSGEQSAAGPGPQDRDQKRMGGKLKVPDCQLAGRRPPSGGLFSFVCADRQTTSAGGRRGRQPWGRFAPDLGGFDLGVAGSLDSTRKVESRSAPIKKMASVLAGWAVLHFRMPLRSEEESSEQF